MNIVLGGIKARRASKNGNDGEEEGAPIARAEEAEESGSAESDKGAPRHEPCIEKGNVAKAKPSEDHAATQAATEEAEAPFRSTMSTSLGTSAGDGEEVKR